MTSNDVTAIGFAACGTAKIKFKRTKQKKKETRGRACHVKGAKLKRANTEEQQHKHVIGQQNHTWYKTIISDGRQSFLDVLTSFL